MTYSRASLLFLSLLGVLNLTGCTWIQDYRAQGKAEDQIRAELREKLTKEFDEMLGAGFPRRNDYVEFMLGRTEIEFGDVVAAGNETAVNAKVRSVSGQARVTLLEIIRPLKDQKLSAFNFEDALRMLSARGVSIELEQQKRVIVGD